MKTVMGMEKAKVRISETLGTKIATRLFRGLALGALLVAATGLYFSINQGEAGSPPLSERTEVYPEFLQTEVWLPGDTYPASVVTDPEAVRPLSNRELERLDYQIDMMLIAEAYKPSAVRPLSNREIERMDYEVDMMLIAEAYKPSAVRPLSNREIERMDYEVDMMLIEASRDP